MPHRVLVRSRVTDEQLSCCHEHEGSSHSVVTSNDDKNMLEENRIYLTFV